MKTFNDWIPILLVSILLAGCSNNNEEEQPAPSKYITVNTGILSRVTDDGTAFTAGDDLSLYGWTGDKDKPTTENMVVNGMRNTFDGANWTPEMVMLWKDTTTPHYFAAVSPARLVSNFTSQEVTLTGVPAEDDIMTATNLKGVTAGDGPVILKFTHLMSRVILVLTYKNEFGYDSDGKPVVPQLEKALINVKSTAMLNVMENSATLKSNADTAPIPLAQVTPSTKYQLITVPQTIPAASPFITLKVKGNEKEYIYRPAKQISLDTGKSTTITLSIGRDAIYPGSLSVEGWGDGEEHKGEAV